MLTYWSLGWQHKTSSFSVLSLQCLVANRFIDDITPIYYTRKKKQSLSQASSGKNILAVIYVNPDLEGEHKGKFTQQETRSTKIMF